MGRHQYPHSKGLVVKVNIWSFKLNLNMYYVQPTKLGPLNTNSLVVKAYFVPKILGFTTLLWMKYLGLHLIFGKNKALNLLNNKSVENLTNLWKTFIFLQINAYADTPTKEEPFELKKLPNSERFLFTLIFLAEIVVKDIVSEKNIFLIIPKKTGLADDPEL